MTRPTIIINGSDTAEIGLSVTSLPPIQIASERVTRIPVPGRSGYLHQSDDSFDSLIKTCGFFYKGDDLVGVARYLQATRSFVFSNDPDHLFYGRINGAVDLTKTIRTWHEFNIEFECDPESRESNPQEIAGASGMSLYNPGNRKAYPTFEITGTGTIVLTVGDQVVTLTSVSGTTVVDGELKECYRTSGASRNNYMSGGWPVILPGETVIILCTGSVTEFVIRPNWRYV